MTRLTHLKPLGLLILIATSTAGCDFLGLGGAIYSGVVVDAETQEPIEGIQMSLKIGGGGFGSYTIVAAVLTDGEGRFKVRDPEVGSSGRPDLYVNSPNCFGSENCPYNSMYSGGNLDYDNRRDIRVELQRRLN